MIRVEPCTEEDIQWITPRLRPEDAAEIEAASGLTPAGVVPRSVEISRECYVMRWDTQPAYVIFGVTDDPDVPGLGIIWLLATPEVSQRIRGTFRTSLKWLKKLSKNYPLGLHNVVWAENLLHLRWCLWAGFQVQGDMYRNGHVFIHITWNCPSPMHIPPHHKEAPPQPCVTP